MFRLEKKGGFWGLFDEEEQADAIGPEKEEKRKPVGKKLVLAAGAVAIIAIGAVLVLMAMQNPGGIMDRATGLASLGNGEAKEQEQEGEAVWKEENARGENKIKKATESMMSPLGGEEEATITMKAKKAVFEAGGMDALAEGRIALETDGFKASIEGNEFAISDFSGEIIVERDKVSLDGVFDSVKGGQYTGMSETGKKARIEAEKITLDRIAIDEIELETEKGASIRMDGLGLEFKPEDPVMRITGFAGKITLGLGEITLEGKVKRIETRTAGGTTVNVYSGEQHG